jgi:hypothetical protein
MAVSFSERLHKEKNRTSIMDVLDEEDLLDTHLHLTLLIETTRELQGKYTEIRPTPDHYQKFVDRALRTSKAVPKVRKLFLYGRENSVQQEIWFCDKDNPDRGGNKLLEYVILHVHHDAKRESAETISPHTDFQVINAANMRYLAEICSANFEGIKPPDLAWWILKSPFEETIPSKLSLKIFPRDDSKGNWHWAEYPEVDSQLSALLKISSDVEFWRLGEDKKSREVADHSPGLESIDLANVERKTKGKYALCIGIDDYKFYTKISNCGKGAELFKEHLRKLDCDVVMLTESVETDRRALVTEVANFGKTIAASKVSHLVFCYISAHGFLLDGQLYLLPSDFPFQTLDNKEKENLLAHAYPLQHLIHQVQKSCSKQPVARLFLLDCYCIDIATSEYSAANCFGEKLRIDRFDKEDGMMVVSLHYDQQDTNFAAEFAKHLFESELSIYDAVVKAIASLNAKDFGRYYTHLDGFLEPNFTFSKATRKELFKNLVCRVGELISERIDSPFSSPRSAEDVLSRADTSLYVSDDSEEDNDSAWNEVVAGYNEGSMDDWQESLQNLLDTVENCAWTPAMRIIASFTRRSLKPRMRGWWDRRCATCWTSSDDFEDMAASYISLVNEQEIECGADFDLFSDGTVDKGASKLGVYEFVAELLVDVQHRHIWKDAMYDKVSNSDISSIDFLKDMDESLLIIAKTLNEQVLRSAFAVPNKSFTVFFKPPRLLQILLFDVLKYSNESIRLLFDMGYRSFASSSRSFIPISLCSSISISTDSSLKLRNSLRRLTCLHAIEVELLVRYVTGQYWSVSSNALVSSDLRARV